VKINRRRTLVGAVAVSAAGLPLSRLASAQDFPNKPIKIVVPFAAGSATDTVWTCDLSHDYVSINADYRS